MILIALDQWQRFFTVGRLVSIGYHQNFQGRTTWEPGYWGLPPSVAVTMLRSQVVTGTMPLSAAPEPIQNALAYMAERLKKVGLPTP